MYHKLNWIFYFRTVLLFEFHYVYSMKYKDLFWLTWVFRNFTLISELLNPCSHVRTHWFFLSFLSKHLYSILKPQVNLLSFSLHVHHKQSLLAHCQMFCNFFLKIHLAFFCFLSISIIILKRFKE